MGTTKRFFLLHTHFNSTTFPVPLLILSANPLLSSKSRPSADICLWQSGLLHYLALLDNSIRFENRFVYLFHQSKL